MYYHCKGRERGRGRKIDGSIDFSKNTNRKKPSYYIIKTKIK